MNTTIEKTAATKTFRGQTDYKTAFATAVTELIERQIPDRQARIEAIDALINEYVEAVGERPDKRWLYRLANEILREELTDKHPDKMARVEYPVMSDTQLERRREKTRFIADVHIGTETGCGRQRVPIEKDDWYFVDGRRKLYRHMTRR